MCFQNEPGQNACSLYKGLFGAPAGLPLVSTSSQNCPLTSGTRGAASAEGMRRLSTHLRPPAASFREPAPACCAESPPYRPCSVSTRGPGVESDMCFTNLIPYGIYIGRNFAKLMAAPPAAAACSLAGSRRVPVPESTTRQGCRLSGEG